MSKKVFVCKKCKKQFPSFWGNTAYGYCPKHAFPELNKQAEALMYNSSLEHVFPLQEKREMANKLWAAAEEVNTGNMEKYKHAPQTAWSNSAGVCQCLESRFPLSHEGTCPLCFAKHHLEANYNSDTVKFLSGKILYSAYAWNAFLLFATILEDLRQSQSQLIVTIANDKENAFDIQWDKEFVLMGEEMMVFSWLKAAHVQKLLNEWQVIWKSEETAIRLVAQVLETDNYIRHYTWNWLLSPYSNAQMHVDGFFPEYNLAVEFQGKQHFEAVEYFGGQETFEKTQARDQHKRMLLQSNNILLLEIIDKDLRKEKIKSKLGTINIITKDETTK